MHDAGWRHFRSILTCKAACAGKRVDAESPRVYVPGVFRLRGTDPEDVVRADPCRYDLRPQAGPRSERGEEYPLARAAPSGTRGDTCGDEPSTRWAVAHTECQCQGLLPVLRLAER